jgi:ribosomal protein S18 acetylase RimI-like enzyme
MPAAPPGADTTDENLVAHSTAATRHIPGARVVLTPDIVLVDSGLPCDTFNIICRARFSTAAARKGIAGALAFFAVTGHPFSWWLAPGYAPDTLPALLEEAGLVAAESELAMAMDLSALQPPPPPPGLEIRRVRSQEDLMAFATVTAGNWVPPDANVPRYYAQARPAFLDTASPQRLYLGLLDGQPVATAELTVSEGAVGLYNISTLSAYRGRRIGTAMTAFPLTEARSAGHRTAILQAAPDGVRLYARLGFTRVGEVTEFKPGALRP